MVEPPRAPVPAPAKIPLWPLLVGNLSGTSTPIEGRPLKWEIALASPSDGVRAGELTIVGEGLSIRVALSYDLASAHLTWRITEAKIDITSWMTALASRPELAALAGTTVTGTIELSGDGTLTDGVPSGRITAEWRDATAGNVEQGWSVDGVTLRVGSAVNQNVNLRELVDLRSIPVELAVQTISTSRFGARNFKAVASVENFKRINVSSARVEIAGGYVSAAPFDFVFSEPSLNLALSMKGVGLQDLIVFVPTTLSDARGRINGDLLLKWNPTDGVEVGAGNLMIDKDEAATVRLASQPGFLTERVPAKFVLAPWLGPLKGLFAPKNPSYSTLSAIELGQLGLAVDELEVRMNPDGDEKGRSASAFIRAHPQSKDSAVKEVTFTINITGPLSQIFRIGVGDDKASMTIR